MGRGFKGEYNHTVDAKGRLIVPAKFREALGETFVVTKGLDGCLFLYPNEEWAIIETKFRELPLTADCEVDKQGRILLPAVLRDFAAIGKEVVLVGVLNRVEIWSKERWLGENEYEDMDEAAEHMAALGLSI